MLQALLNTLRKIPTWFYTILQQLNFWLWGIAAGVMNWALGLLGLPSLELPSFDAVMALTGMADGFRALNDWFPLTEAITAIQTYMTVYFVAVAVHVVKKHIPFIGGGGG
jgi:hypothetical protein